MPRCPELDPVLCLLPPPVTQPSWDFLCPVGPACIGFSVILVPDLFPGGSWSPFLWPLPLLAPVFLEQTDPLLHLFHSNRRTDGQSAPTAFPSPFLPSRAPPPPVISFHSVVLISTSIVTSCSHLRMITGYLRIQVLAAKILGRKTPPRRAGCLRPGTRLALPFQVRAAVGVRGRVGSRGVMLWSPGETLLPRAGVWNGDN